MDMKSSDFVTVIIPTYNERENIQILIPKIEKIFKNNNITGEIMIIDDNSPDGTGEVADRFSKVFKNIKVIHRPYKLGLGSAYITGFKNATGNIIFEMDADLSHNPLKIPHFIKTINNGYDFVIGSRYIRGGEVIGWSIYRKIISKGANLLAKIFLSLRTKDVTSGYRAYRRETLKKINYETIKSSGYAFQLEILYRAFKKGCKIKEIPITFIDRRKGRSKLSKKEIFSFFLMLLKLKLGSDVF